MKAKEYECAYIYRERERSAICNIDREIRIIKFRGDPSKMSGNIEVRGIVNKDGTISYGEFTQYDQEFGKLKENIA